MDKHFLKYLFKPISVILLVVLLGVLLFSLTGVKQSASAQALPAQPVRFAEGDIAACQGCHGQPGQITALPNDEPLFLSIDTQLFAESVHGQADKLCTDCHVNIETYPHPPITAKDRRSYSLQYQYTCKNCHVEQYAMTADSIHTQALLDGNVNAPTCVDCHNPHNQAAIHDAAGNIYESAYANVPNVCARCHSQIYDQYAESVHGAGVVNEGNTDSPTCVGCHTVHTIGDTKDPAFKVSSIQMCANCHTNEALMEKYGLSTQVLDTYVADFHGTTAVLFEKQSPDEETNVAVCYDCHGIHDIKKVSDPNAGIAIKENLMVKCQACHPNATADFPTSWLGHYIPAPDKAALVFYVQWFYKLLIPAVLGAMVILNGTDLYRRIWGKKSAAKEGDSPAVDTITAAEVKEKTTAAKEDTADKTDTTGEGEAR